MKFFSGQDPHLADSINLTRSPWDDWWSFDTQFIANYLDEDRNKHRIGAIKIAQVGLKAAKAGEVPPDAPSEPFRTPTLPSTFEALDSSYYSLAQDVDFYTNLYEILGEATAQSILTSLNECAFNSEIFKLRRQEPAMKTSLMRYVPESQVIEQFSRAAKGMPPLTSWDFKIVVADPKKPSSELAFHVDPNSALPSNLQVLIGRNGVGKSWFLNKMAKTVYDTHKIPTEKLDTQMDSATIGQIKNLTGLVSVSFSAFDQFEPISTSKEGASGFLYSYVGLKKVGARNDEPTTLKSPSALASELTKSVRYCLSAGLRDRWLQTLRLLEGDPVFASIGISQTFSDLSDDEALQELKKVYKKLSSGHAIVLLTITRLVETVKERTLVLLDEPEAHLHPPLISAFVRAISTLLSDRNGVAIIATHSPVIVQEVPKASVHKISRAGWRLLETHPTAETFGENVGTLTDEVFGLEVVATGYHKILSDLVMEGLDYDEILYEKLDHQLGEEGQAVLGALIDSRDGEAHVAREE